MNERKRDKKGVGKGRQKMCVGMCMVGVLVFELSEQKKKNNKNNKNNKKNKNK